MKKFIILLALVAYAGNLWSYDPYYAPHYDSDTGDWSYKDDESSTFKCYFHFATKEADLQLTIPGYEEFWYGFNLKIQTENVVIPDKIYLTTRYAPGSGGAEIKYEYTVVKMANGLCKEQVWIKTVTLPSTLKSTDGYVFRDCTGLTHATYPANCVCDISDGMFFGCANMNSITFPDNLQRIGSYAFAYTGFTSLYIPSTVTSIGEGAFQRCKGMTWLHIPLNVASIGPRIAYGCENFTEFTVNPDNAYFSAVDGVLFNKDQTRIQEYPYGKKGAYTIPNTVTEITESNFAKYPNLTKVTIGDGVTKIRREAFTGSTNLTTVIFGSSVDTLGEYAFKDCYALDTVVLSSSLKCIGKGAFNTCEALRSLTIPDNVKTIKSMAFAACSNLNAITLGKNLTKIEIMAFIGCTNLNSITCYATTPPELQEGHVFWNGGGYLPGVDKATCVVYVPMSAVDAYKNATEWKEFTHIVGFREPASDVITTEPKAIRKLVYNGSVQTLISAGELREGASATLKYRIGTEGAWSTELPQATDAGAYDVYYYIDYGQTGDADPENIFGPVACLIAKVTPTLTAAPAAIPALGYDGSAKTLITAGSTEHGTLEYSLDNETWSEDLPKATEQGHYRVYYRIIGSSNYSDLGGYVPLVATIGITSAPAAPLHEDYDPEKIEALAAQQGEDTKGFWIFYGEGYQRLFDGDKETKWCSWTDGVPAYCQRPKDVAVWKTEEPVKMVSYTLTTADDAASKPQCNWNSWTLYGGSFADDDEAEEALLTEEGWNVIDNRINDNVLQAQDLANFQFAVSNPDTFQYYRLVIHDIVGDGNVQQMTNLTMGLATNLLPTYITRPSERAYLTYIGAEQTLIEPGTATNGTVMYRLKGDAEWRTDLPKATAAGNYYVYYKTQADEYAETKPDTLIATIYGDRTVPTHEDLAYDKIRVLTYRQGVDTHIGQTAIKLFDGEDNDKEWRKWCSLTNNVNYPDRPKDIVVWKTDEGVKMVSYTLQIGYDSYEYPNRNWSSWTLYGGYFASDDDAENAVLNEDAWIVIDNQIKDTVLQEINNAMYEFACNNPGVYQYYRLVIHDLHVTHPESPKGIQQMEELTMGIEPSQTPTAIEETNANAKAAKLLRDGHLYIIRDDKVYTITGQLCW